MRWHDSYVYEIVGDSLAELPDGAVAFLQYVCSFCGKLSTCLVNDNTYGEYGPASICENCISVLRAAREQD